MKEADKYIDVMIDLETLGTAVGCKILEIGAVTFDGMFEFERLIERKSQLLFEDKGTLDWWISQGEDAWGRVSSGKVGIAAVLAEFTSWIKDLERQYNKPVRVWGNAASFDISILEHAYKAYFFQSLPWKYYNVMCFRTLKNLYPQIKAPEFVGQKHMAIWDAKHQVRHANVILNYRNGAELLASQRADQVLERNMNHAYEG